MTDFPIFGKTMQAWPLEVEDRLKRMERQLASLKTPQPASSTASSTGPGETIIIQGTGTGGDAPDLSNVPFVLNSQYAGLPNATLLQGTANQVTVTHAAGYSTVSLPGAVTISSDVQSGYAAYTYGTGTVSSGSRSVFIGYGARGTQASPTAIQSGDNIALFLGRGYAATDWADSYAGMKITAAENFTATNSGTKLDFWVVPTGGNVEAIGATLGADSIFQALGGYKSADGTAGASATTGGATFKNGLYVSGTISAGGEPAGSDNAMQYNNGGSFGGAEIYYNETNKGLGIGADPDAYDFYIERDGDYTAALSRSYGGTTYYNLNYQQRSRGSKASPAATQSGDIISLYTWYGYESTTPAFGPIAAQYIECDGNTTSTSRPGRIRWHTTAVNATTVTEAMRITSGQDLLIGATTGTGRLVVKGAAGVVIQSWVNSSGSQVANMDASGILQTSGYKSSDGSSGYTSVATMYYVKTISPGVSYGTMTFKNGLLTAIT